MKKLIVKIIKLLFPDLIIEEEKKAEDVRYEKKKLLTCSEKIFYKKLVKIEDIGNYKVIPQINLSTIVKKISKNKYQNELYRNIDFAIFDKELEEIIALIELNDSSHNQKNRIDRDLKVRKICDDAGIKVINFSTKYPNKEEYIINHILEKIKD